MHTITKDMTIAQAIAMDQNIIPVLLEIGMHCLGCPSHRVRHWKKQNMVHGLDPDDLMDRIYAQIGSK